MISAARGNAAAYNSSSALRCGLRRPPSGGGRDAATRAVTAGRVSSLVPSRPAPPTYSSRSSSFSPTTSRFASVVVVVGRGGGGGGRGVTPLVSVGYCVVAGCIFAGGGTAARMEALKATTTADDGTDDETRSYANEVMEFLGLKRPSSGDGVVVDDGGGTRMGGTTEVERGRQGRAGGSPSPSIPRPSPPSPSYPSPSSQIPMGNTAADSSSATRG